MPSLSKLGLNTVLALGIVLPGLAVAMPLSPAKEASVESDVILAQGVVCDLNGCRTYNTNNRRPIYRDDRSFDEDIYNRDRSYDDEPEIYQRPRVERRIYVRPPVEPGLYPPRLSRSRQHVAWCSDRYRSYNPRTDLFVVRSGVYRHCISPYS